jgi:hypothetical protein
LSLAIGRRLCATLPVRAQLASFPPPGFLNMPKNSDQFHLRVQGIGSALAGGGPSGEPLSVLDAIRERDTDAARGGVAGTPERSTAGAIQAPGQRGFSPAIRWREHLPIASAALVPLLAQSSERGAEFPPAERAMFMACEFWAAVTSRTLVQYLGVDGIGTLRYMVIVYLAAGAHVSARAIARAVACVRGCSTAEARQACLIELQLRLVAANEPVDSLLAGLVKTLETGLAPESGWVRADDVLLIAG